MLERLLATMRYTGAVPIKDIISACERVLAGEIGAHPLTSLSDPFVVNSCLSKIINSPDISAMLTNIAVNWFERILDGDLTKIHTCELSYKPLMLRCAPYVHITMDLQVHLCTLMHRVSPELIVAAVKRDYGHSINNDYVWAMIRALSVRGAAYDVFYQAKLRQYKEQHGVLVF